MGHDPDDPEKQEEVAAKLMKLAARLRAKKAEKRDESEEQ